MPAGYSPGDMAVDKAGGFLYWINSAGGKIQRADLDGGNIVDIATGISGLHRLALDGAGKIYWTTGTSFSAESTIWRADVDGTNVEAVFGFPIGRSAIAVDPEQGHIYWSVSNSIFRSPLDGRSEDVWDDLWADACCSLFIEDLAFHRSAGEMYYVSWTPPFNFFAPDGTVGKVGGWSVFGEDRGLHIIALDVEHGHVYWTDITKQKLLRANLDGTDMLPVLDIGGAGVALGPCPPGDSCPPPPVGPTATPTPTITPTPNPVGGVSLGRGLAALSDDSEGLETNETRGGRLMPWVVAGFAPVLALVCGAWYAHRRWIRR